ncbi:MAG: Gfo/Idh/MocA family oxidoreductase [Candidatus Nealsonbacteria bacterium]|nr:Gfo/Idh/MocA family oxidoreductase [Candidatus Nealsonbacteria bacterium]
MSQSKPTRRDFLKTTAGVAAAGSVPYVWTSSYAKAQDKNDRPNMASIGVGGMGGGDGRRASGFANMLACADVDRGRAERFAGDARFGGKCEIYGDYHKVLDRKDVDVVTIGTPDHWHSKIVIDALKAGKDVQCQKPLTLTIDEGKQICKVVKSSGKILHIGTQQRSENRSMFLKAVVLAMSGRLGNKLTATCSIGGGPAGGPWEPSDPPAQLDWDFWLGQTPKVPYTAQRCHGNFRWWFEYSGGKMTDWGAHHIDIAQWGLGYTDSGPVEIEGTAKFPDVYPADFSPVKFFAGEQELKNGYNTATEFKITATYKNGNKMIVQHGPDNGVWFEGEKGRIFVNRGKLTGKPIEDLTAADNEWLDKEVVKLYLGMQPGDHMRHFFDCLKQRKFTISDPFTHHRTMTTCHLCNLAILLKRKLRWDPAKEDFIGDDEASALRSRPQRAPYQIEV